MPKYILKLVCWVIHTPAFSFTQIFCEIHICPLHFSSPPLRGESDFLAETDTRKTDKLWLSFFSNKTAPFSTLFLLSHFQLFKNKWTNYALSFCETYFDTKRDKNLFERSHHHRMGLCIFSSKPKSRVAAQIVKHPPKTQESTRYRMQQREWLKVALETFLCRVF